MTKQTTRRLKIASYGITIGTVHDPKTLKLLGLNDFNLKSANSYFESLPKEMALEENIPQDSLFFYKIEQFDNQPYPRRKLIAAEKGIGVITSKDKTLFLERLQGKRYYNEETGWLASVDDRLYDFDNNKYIIITTSLPSSLDELFTIKDTVVCSLGNKVPELVPLQDNTLLGKIEGDIQSIDGSEMHNMIGPQSIQKIFLSYDLPLAINTDNLELTGKNSSLRSNSLILKSTRSRPKPPIEGSIIYNSRKKAFQGFDGETWKTFKWEK